MIKQSYLSKACHLLPMTPSFSQGVDGHLAGCLGSLHRTAKCKSKALPGEREREREERERGREREREKRERERDGNIRLSRACRARARLCRLERITGQINFYSRVSAQKRQLAFLCFFLQIGYMTN